jgi:hypothetical protein
LEDFSIVFAGNFVLWVSVGYLRISLYYIFSRISENFLLFSLYFIGSEFVYLQRLMEKQIISFISVPLVSQRLFSTVLNKEGYRYGINSPISLQFLQLESHGSQLSGQQTE